MKNLFKKHVLSKYELQLLIVTITLLISSSVVYSATGDADRVVAYRLGSNTAADIRAVYTAYGPAPQAPAPQVMRTGVAQAGNVNTGSAGKVTGTFKYKGTTGNSTEFYTDEVCADLKDLPGRAQVQVEFTGTALPDGVLATVSGEDMPVQGGRVIFTKKDICGHNKTLRIRGMGMRSGGAATELP